MTKAGPATGQRGGNVTYTIVVTNDGPSDAQNVLVTDPTPTGLTLVTGLSGPCAVSPGCAMPAGGSQTLSITFAIPPGYAGSDPIANVATASAGTADPDMSNNSGRATTSLDAPVADLTITKTDGVTEVAAGASTTYTITVTNGGPASAAASRVIDQFDPATFASVQWQCAAAGTSACTAIGAQSGNIDTLLNVDPGAGNAVTFTVQAVVRSDATGTADNTATVATAAAVSDPNSENNTATDSDTIASVVDVAYAKTGPTTVVPGTTIEYTIVVTNNGPSVATDVPVIDVMEDSTGRLLPELLIDIVAPPGITCPEVTFVGGGPDAGREFTTRLCTIPSLAPLASLTFTYRFAIPPDFPGSPDSSTPGLFNAVQGFPPFDSDTGNNFDFIPIVVTPQADVVVTKTGPPAVVAGSVVSYFIRVSNSGSSAATNVMIEDPIPAGLSLASAEGPCASGFPCTIATLAPGEGQTTRIDLLVPRDYAGPPTFVNTASATSPVSDPVPGNNSAAASTFVVPEQADLFVAKFGPSVVSPGQTFDYTVFLLNFGPGPAIDVTMADVIPAGTTLVSVTPDPRFTCTSPAPGTGDLLSCRVPIVPVDVPVAFDSPVDTLFEVRFTVLVSPDLAPGSVITNVATVSSPTPDLNSANDRAELVSVVGAAGDADVLVQTFGFPDPVAPGQNVFYNITVRNEGPATATNIVLTDTLPAGFTFVEATPTQGSCAGTTCNLGTLAPSTEALVVLTAITSAAGTFTNTAAVTAAEPDPVPANNTVTRPITVVTPDQADLNIEKLGPAILAPGGSSFYAIRVTNQGPAPAVNVRVLDTLPAGVTFVGNTGDCVTTFPCEFDSLQPFQQVVIQTAFTVAPDLPTPATLVNTASVESPTPDQNISNNSSTVTTEIQPSASADLVVVKRDSPDAVVAGTALSYALALSNRGPSAASGVTLTDALPAGVTVIAATSTQGTCTGTTTITCNVGTMLAGRALSSCSHHPAVQRRTGS